MSKPRYYTPAVVIPEHWTPDDALTVVSFLRCISEAIWAMHGRAMNYRLQQACVGECKNVIPFSYGIPDDDNDADDTDMPF